MISPSSNNKHKISTSLAELDAMVTGMYYGLSKARGYDVVDHDVVGERCLKASKWMTMDNCKPSLVMHGGIGTGKTTLLRAMYKSARYLEQRCAFVTASSLAKMKLEEPDTYEYLLNSWYEYIFIDDVGTEPVEVKSYGNAMYPFVDIVSRRYDLGLPLIITTNLKYPNDFAQIYGERVADRLREMANSMEFKGGSYRK